MQLGIMGAGAIGCYIGGRLQAAGNDVVFIGRRSLGDEVRAHGLHLSDYRGYRAEIPGERIRFEETPDALRDCDVVIVTVKSFDTPATATALAAALSPRTVVVSFQNGVRNPGVLRERLPSNTVLAGMVPFNVVRSDGGRFHSGTSGRLVVEAGDPGAAFVAAVRAAGLDIEARRDAAAVQWGKLLINLGNGVNALAGIPVREQIADRGYRCQMARLIEEAVAALAAAGISAVLEFPLPPKVLPAILRLPTPLFRLLAGAMLKVDPKARSSMQDDLDRRRVTEIDFLNGEVVALAAAHGTSAPANAAIVRLVRAAEQAKNGSPRLSANALATGLAQ